MFTTKLAVVVGGLAVAGLTAAGPAMAAPGVSVSVNGNAPIGIGDNTATGAQASSTKGNSALSISVFKPSNAVAKGEGNNVVAIGSAAVTGANSKGNNVLATGGSRVLVQGTKDNVVAVAGDVITHSDSHGNTIVNAGGFVGSGDQGSRAGVVSLNVCGTQVSGQAAHIEVSKGAC